MSIVSILPLAGLACGLPLVSERKGAFTLDESTVDIRTTALLVANVTPSCRFFNPNVFALHYKHCRNNSSYVFDIQYIG